MKPRALRLLLACCAPCLAVVALASPPPAIEIAPAAERVSVWRGLRVVSSADRQLTPKQAAELAAGSSAMAVESPDRVLGRGTVPYWGLFSLYNPEASEQMRLLALEVTTQFDIRLFERQDKGEWRQVELLADTAAGRPGGGTNHPAWALQLAPRQTAELLLRIEGPAIVRFPLFVYKAGAFVEQQRKLHVAIGIALASCLLSVVFVATLRRYLNDRSVPLFICMILADLVAALWLSGFLSELFPAVPESTLSPIGFAAYALLFGCGCLHAGIYLNAAAWAPRLDRLLHLLGWLCLGLAPWFALAFPVAARILVVWGGTAIASMLVAASILATRKSVPFSGYIGAAWVVYLLFGAVNAIGRVIDNPLVWPSSALGLPQAAAIAILFGLAMSQRLMKQRDLLAVASQEAMVQRERAAAIMRERSLLFAATNHDLRQPLLGVSMFANLLKTAPTAAEREAHWRKLDMALKEVDDLLVSIQQLAAAHEALHQPVLEAVKIDDLLAPVIEEYRGRSQYKRITIRYVPSSQSIITHVPYLIRIVRNVLSNAVRYTDRGDRILVGCRRGGGLRLVIADTGRGMTEEQTGLAFDAFHRFDLEAPVPEGFGLGLFSTRTLANALGLMVSLHSQKGRGTKFTLSLSPIARIGRQDQGAENSAGR